MRKVTLLIMSLFLIGGLMFTSCGNEGRKGKHKSSQGAKKKKSGYFHDFQH